MLDSTNRNAAQETQRATEKLQALRFPTEWREVSDPPKEGGMFIVDLGHKRVCAAYWVPSVGFTLDHSEYIGLEDRIIGWMELPEGR